tara:strand:+ start:416 stop:682 length:267 start_codon:yes stop_codon:yes gene_type:complete
MIKELKYVFYLICILLFFSLIVRYYFSDEFKKKSYREINLYNDKISKFSVTIPVLKNDTKNTVDYLENTSKKNNKKHHFWKLLLNNEK